MVMQDKGANLRLKGGSLRSEIDNINKISTLEVRNSTVVGFI